MTPVPHDIRLITLAGVCLLILSACASRPPLAVDTERLWRSHQALMQELKTWSATGRVGVTADSDGWTASFVWRQSDAFFHIRIHGPFGRGVVELEGNPQRVTLIQAGQPPRHAKDADALLYQQSGWKLPVSGLRYWILGLPVPGQPERHRLDREGKLVALQQDGWRIEYASYHRLDGRHLPKKIQLVNGDLRVKLIASDWQLSARP